MPILTVGPTSTYASISAAMPFALPDDTIVLQSGYSGEDAIVDKTGLTVTGDATSVGITLRLGAGVQAITISGDAAINVFDSTTGNSTEANAILGGSGNNVILVSGGVDAVNGGLGTDTLFVDYAAANGAVTGDSTTNFTDAGGGHTVTITDGTFENFNIVTGDFADTITTGDGNDIIIVGNGANVVSAGQGANILLGGVDADTFTALDGGNYMDGGNGANTLTSGAGSDTIRSGTGADTIVSGGGIDAITVLGGADTVDAGAQADRLIIDYSATATSVTGSLTGDVGSGYTGQFADLSANSVDFVGVENFTITTGTGADTITTGAGTDTISGGDGADVLSAGSGADYIQGNVGADYIQGNVGNDVLRGGQGADTVRGGQGDDYLRGDKDNDMLQGDRGRDTLDGGAGADVLRGDVEGASTNDTFMFRIGEASGDTVLDFNGNGSLTGDVLQFVGFGTSTDATFEQVGSGNVWAITSSNGLTVETITLANGATISSDDYVFI